MFEITVKVSDEEMTLTEHFIHTDENITLSHDDVTLNSMVKSVIDNFKGSPQHDVQIKIKADW